MLAYHDTLCWARRQLALGITFNSACHSNLNIESKVSSSLNAFRKFQEDQLRWRYGSWERNCLDNTIYRQCQWCLSWVSLSVSLSLLSNKSRRWSYKDPGWRQLQIRVEHCALCTPISHPSRSYRYSPLILGLAVSCYGMISGFHAQKEFIIGALRP